MFSTICNPLKLRELYYGEDFYCSQITKKEGASGTKKRKQMRSLTSEERAASPVLLKPFIIGELKLLPSV